jgi:ATP-dependent RNA helicase HelY
MGDPRVAEFQAGFTFPLDDYQISACEALATGSGVLVAAPTGSGKTVVGEFAVDLALQSGRKCFYTTPIKALSNQKYSDLVARFGIENVGLLTGDISLNGEAPVVVMTTEVLRNMLYARSQTLLGLAFVVMDEVHYLADRFRGAAWEEVIIGLPESVAVVALSATVSNAEEFGDWLRTVRGDTEVIVTERRPVPLFQHVMSGRRIYDLFTDDGPTALGQHESSSAKREHAVNPDLVRLARDDQRFHGRVGSLGGRGGGRGGPGNRGRHGQLRGFKGSQGSEGGANRARTPRRTEVIARLESEALLPAIYFIFSRAGCDAAMTQAMQDGVRLTRPDEARAIDLALEAATTGLTTSELETLGYSSFAEGLRRGVASHHAGMLPVFKECVEDLFEAGLVKVVFATETLALGINMPARTVVLEKLTKYNGETHADLTPGEYTQLTGRAGRRGIDVEGHAVVLWQPGLDPRALSGLASTRTYPLRSSFRPSYNMAVNLISTLNRDRARELLESSFAQFQADRSVVGIARSMTKNEEGLAGYAEAMECERGDFLAYAKLRQQLSGRERELSRQTRSHRRTQVIDSLRRLRPGDVIEVSRGRKAGPVVVLDPGYRAGSGDPRPSVLTSEHQVTRLTELDFAEPVELLTRVKMPKSFNSRIPAQRRDMASRMRERLRDVGSGFVKGPIEDSPWDDGDGHQSDPRSSADSTGSDDDWPDEPLTVGGVQDPRIVSLRQALTSHPCHGCPEREEHARWATRYLELEAQTAGMRRSIESRTNTLGREFDRVCRVLDALGYLDGDELTDAGQMLRTIYTELDLLVAESLRSGVFEDLSAAELAACVAAAVFQARSSAEVGEPQLPTAGIRHALTRMSALWRDLRAAEAQQKVSYLREIDPGFCGATYLWAAGAPLDVVLEEGDFAAGDFVRWTKQVLDVLGQVGDATSGPVRATAREAVGLLRRGLVAHSG